MKMKVVPVTQEYLESLCEWMMEWVGQKDAYTFPQFLAWKGIGYPYFKYFCYCCDSVNNTFEAVKAILHTKWMDLVMTKDELPAHRSKVLMRYLRLYDGHSLDVEKQLKQAEAEATAYTQMGVKVDEYGNAELQQPYKDLYDANEYKRRDREESK